MYVSTVPDVGCFVGWVPPWVVLFALRVRGPCGHWQRKLLVVQRVSSVERGSWKT